jgi:hypothetical protein
MTADEKNECRAIILSFKTIGAKIVIRPGLARQLKRHGLWDAEACMVSRLIPKG